jgi:hypothetical protein
MEHTLKYNRWRKVVMEESTKMVAQFRTRVVPYFGQETQMFDKFSSLKRITIK